MKTVTVRAAARVATRAVDRTALRVASIAELITKAGRREREREGERERKKRVEEKGNCH